ncbi:uncharacterized protein PG998_001107 [Apiospora kogelbergensis]|uniref:uncharacterized protein n=1 Tax=Apiospora kogelbergensis TaxID=1337665 RepID=UPI00313158A1
MSEKATVSHNESHDGSTSNAGITGQKSKASKGHCKRFWWIYMAVLAVIVLIVVPCIIFVAVPRMAQSKLDAAKLDIDSIVISQAESDSFHMAINSTILADNGVHATIRAFEGNMYLLSDGVSPDAAAHPFAKFGFPEVESSAAVVVNVSQKVAVEDVDSLVAFNEQLLSQEFVNVRVEGDTQIRVAGIARDYPDVQLKAFNGFAGISVSNINVSLASINNFNGTVHIPNPTVFTFEIGNTTWNNYLNGGANVGSAYIRNLAMHPGNNDFFIWADIVQGPVLTALGKKPVCESAQGDLTFQLSGKVVENHGQSIPWLATALSAHNASVTMPVGAAVAKALNAKVPCSQN